MKTIETPSIQLEALRTSCPAIFATQPAAGVSEHYQFVPTLRLITPMIADGWEIYRAKQQQTGQRTTLTTTACHHIVLRHKSLPTIEDGTAEIHIINSHDRTKRLFIGAGFFRLVCSNGLIAMTSGVISKKMTHLDNIIKVDELMANVHAVTAAMPELMEDIHKFRDLSLTKEDQRLFASEALKARYGSYTPTVSTESVLNVRRAADAGDSLWLVLNRVQENIMHGVVDGKRSSKPMSSLVEQVKVNKRLWELAQMFVNKSSN